MWPVVARTHTAIGFPHRAVIRVEVWRGDTQLTADAPIVDGSVTDTWATGPRRTLDMRVPATDQWRQWLTLGVEIRPFRGVDFGGGVGGVEMCPLGCFPVLQFTRPRVASTLSVRATDKYERVSAAPFRGPTASLSGSVKDVIAYLLGEVDPYGTTVTNTATSLAATPSVIWQPSRTSTIADLATSIGVEVFMDRLGQPVIRDRVRVGAPVVTFRAGPGGTMISADESVDWSNTFNTVSAHSTNTESPPGDVQVAIWDPMDPAHRRHFVGDARSGGWRNIDITSAVWKTGAEIRAAAVAKLLEVAGPAKTWSVGCVPDPSLDAGDTVGVETDTGAVELAQIKSVTHPLTAQTVQQVTTVSTREDTF